MNPEKGDAGPPPAQGNGLVPILEHPCIIAGLNEAIPLTRSEPATVSVAGKEEAGSAQIRLEFLPVPRIAADIRLDKAPGLFAMDDVGKTLKLKAQKVAIHVLPTSVRFSSERQPIVRLLGIDAIDLGNPGERALHRVSFLVLNFPGFFGTERAVYREGNRSEALDMITLQAHPWQIRLQLATAARGRIKEAKRSSGYVVTHVGEVLRIDGQSFSGKEVLALLDCLRRFLSFAIGRKCGVVLPYGFDLQSNVVWCQWWTDLFEPWLARRAWFDGSKGALVENAFLGYMKRQAQPKWTRPLRDAIYWYLMANNSLAGIDAGIILAQPALELLAWTYLVEDKALFSRSQFRKLKAHEAIRALLDQMGIPAAAPREALRRIRASVSTAPAEIPQLVAKVRNALVHPRGTRIDPYLQVMANVWSLALWTVEMALLRIIGYSGEYSNRLVSGYVGEYEEVPWAT